MPTTEDIRDEDKFKTFAAIVSNSKTNPTAAERAVQETPFITKDGNLLKTALAVVDRALYKPSVKQNVFTYAPPHTDSEEKAYTKYQFVNTTINKVEDFFEDVDYDVNVGNINFTKNLNPNLQVGANVDILGNFSLSAAKKYGSIEFSGAAQYKPAQQEGRLNLNFTNGEIGASTNVYVNDYNPGIMTNFTKTLKNNTNIGAGISIFKENTNAYVKLKHDNVCISAYGSAIKSPYIGISAMVTY